MVDMGIRSHHVFDWFQEPDRRHDTMGVGVYRIETRHSPDYRRAGNAAVQTQEFINELDVDRGFDYLAADDPIGIAGALDHDGRRRAWLADALHRVVDDAAHSCDCS